MGSTTSNFYSTTTEEEHYDDHNDDDDDHDDDDHDDDDDYGEIECPPNEIYCMSLGYCTSDCGGNDYIHCAKGEKYCWHSGICAKNCNDDDDQYGEENDDQEIKCPKGTIFSLDTWTCVDR